MATLVVTTLDDEAFDGPETVGSPDGSGLSLREALSLTGSDDTITFDPNLTGGTLTLTNGVFVLFPRDDFTIDGDIDNDGSPDITIDANGSSQHFYLFNGSTNLTFDGLTFANGSNQHGGGSIALGSSDVAISNSRFVDNEVTDVGGGGAIFTNPGSNLRIYNSEFLSNDTEGAGLNGNGGAISNAGNLYISESTFHQNASLASGGAIVNKDGSQLTVFNSTFQENRGFIGGGAIANYGDTTIFNSTFVGNSAFEGGAIYGGGEMYVGSSTFTGNYAAAAGGAIYSYSSASDFTIANSILAGNETSLGIDDLYTNFGFQNLGGNIIGSNVYADGVNIGTTALHEIFGRMEINGLTHVYSGRLADNGGAVETVMINRNGAAVDQGFSNLLPTDVLDLDQDLNVVEKLPVDSRGVERVFNGALDIGSVELRISNGTNASNAITGDHFTEVISGGEGHDTLRGLNGEDTLDGGAGKDLVFGNDGADFIIGGDDNDDLRGSLGHDTLYGDKGQDYIRGNSNRDDLRGGSGDDTLDGGLHGDELRGASGDDDLYGRIGNDLLLGGKGNDLLLAHSGDDSLFGELGNDTLGGGDGSDLLSGGSGHDDLQGGDANDTLFGGKGNDALNGGDGDDQINFALGDGEDEITGFTAGAASDDVIALSNFGAAFDSFAEVMAVTSDDGFGNTVIDFGGGDSILLGGISSANLHEDDFIFG